MLTMVLLYYKFKVIYYITKHSGNILGMSVMYTGILAQNCKCIKPGKHTKKERHNYNKLLCLIINGLTITMITTGRALVFCLDSVCINKVFTAVCPTHCQK